MLLAMRMTFGREPRLFSLPLRVSTSNTRLDRYQSFKLPTHTSYSRYLLREKGFKTNVPPPTFTLVDELPVVFLVEVACGKGEQSPVLSLAQIHKHIVE